MLDNIDWKILNELKGNAKISNIDLSDKVGLSPSPCLRRVKTLEKKGFIKGYSAIIDYEMLGLGLNVFIQVSLLRQDEASLSIFEKEIIDSKEVMEAYLMTGDSDYLLRVVSKDLNTYEEFIKKTLTKINGIANIRTSFALKQIKESSY